MAGEALVLGMIGGTAALIGAVAYATNRARKARAEAMRGVATTMGFGYEESATPDGLGAFPLMEHGRSREGRNALTGKLADRSATICDYRYVIQSGKSSHQVIQTVVIFTDPQPGLPDFDLRPENVLHKLASVFGYQDIDFDGNEEFSKRYLLRGTDEEAIRRVFNSNVQMMLANEPGWNVQASAGRLMVFRSGKVTDAPSVPSFAADTQRVAGVFRS